MDNRNPSTHMLHLSDNATTSVAVKCRKGDDGEKVRTVVLASVDDSGYHEFVFFCRSLEQVRGLVPDYKEEA